MEKNFGFEIEKKSNEAKLARAGKITTPHGEILIRVLCLLAHGPLSKVYKWKI